MEQYDAIIIGAGHNGLVAGAYLARSGLRVLICERREIVGGACVTEEIFPGTKFSTCASVVSCLRQRIYDELELEKHGLELYPTNPSLFVLGETGEHFTIWPELDRTLAELDALHSGDGNGFIDFGLKLRRFASLVSPYLLRNPPTLSELIRTFEDAGEIELYHEFVELSAADLSSHYFGGDLAKAAFCYLGLVALNGSVDTPGSAYLVSHHAWGEYKGELGRSALAKGGMGSITQALARCAESYGATIKTGAAVDKILQKRQKAYGIRLQNNKEFHAPIILSNADPRTTYLNFLGKETLTAKTYEHAKNIDYRGAQARVFIQSTELPKYEGFPDEYGPHHEAVTILGASMKAYRHCADALANGRLADRYPLELLTQSTTDPSMAAPGTYGIALGIQQIPYDLAHGTWEERREEFTQIVLQSLYNFAPNLKKSITNVRTLTPWDLEQEYGLCEGNQFHGSMVPVQRFSARPFPGANGYHTEIKGLYLCGAGTHPGGGVMGACGHNAAKSVLADMGKGPAMREDQVKSKSNNSDLINTLAQSPKLMGARNWSLRQAWLRPVIKMLNRSNID